MTVCVSLLCENGKIAVVASDRMTTASHPPMEFEHKKKKIHDINEHTVCLNAGDALRPKEILEQSRRELAGQKSPSVALITSIVKQHYGNVRRSLAEDTHLRPRGVTLKEFYSTCIRTWPDGLAMALDRAIATSTLGVKLMVCGVDGDGGHIHVIGDPCSSLCYDSLGYMAIGIGQTHALSILTAGFDIGLSANDAKKLVLKAKRVSEIAPGVGSKTDMAIISGEGVHHLTDDEIVGLEN